MAEEIVRLRLVFEDRCILRKAQRKQGLEQCWVLLNPQHHTISEFSAYLLQKFDLFDSCPRGLVLLMDGFVLPTFESTSILKDKDIISVKKKKRALSEIVKPRVAVNSSDGFDLAVNQPALRTVKLLANEGFQEETSGYETESEEYEPETMQQQKPVKKRKAYSTIHNLKGKRCKLSSGKSKPKGKRDKANCLSPCNISKRAKRSIAKEAKSPNLQGHFEKASDDDACDKVDEIKECDAKSAKQEEHSQRTEDISQKPSETKKQPSRSARRKKAKRLWLREQATLEQKQTQQEKLIVEVNNESSGKDDKKDSTSFIPPSNDVIEDIGDKVVPVEVRPGHIRFEPLDEGDEAVEKRNNYEVPMKNFQWNGITSKRKGQRWGRESSYPKQSYRNYNQEFSQELAEEAEMPKNGHLDYEKLSPYSGCPKEGDIIAYKLIELSSSWTPEISSFRVGKISSYIAESKNIVLIEVPEYPIEKKIDEGTELLLPDVSLYKEDRSLEIEFPSLLDVRLVKGVGSSIERPEVDGFNETHLPYLNAKVSQPTQNSDARHSEKVSDDRQANAWDEISLALSAKKEELSRENGWGKENSGRRSWAYKALRGSALGPTMAYLRAQDGLLEAAT